MSEKNVIITKIPIYAEGSEGQRQVVSRLIKKKGELATICVDPINYLAYSEVIDDMHYEKAITGIL